MTESEHTRNQDDRITALEKGQEEILALLRPISDTYRTASSLGKWVMALLVFVSIAFGVLLSFKELWRKP